MLFARFSSRSSKALTRAGVWILALASSWAIFIALVFFLLSLAGCAGYNPALFPSYDCLNPGSEVRKNPLSISEDPITREPVFIVNQAFILWVDELKTEIIKLRKGK